MKIGFSLHPSRFSPHYHTMPPYCYCNQRDKFSLVVLTSNSLEYQYAWAAALPEMRVVRRFVIVDAGNIFFNVR